MDTSNWQGTLTVNNIEEVSQRLLELLKGKKFTLVITTSESSNEPRVYTSQVLCKTNPIQISNVIGGIPSASFVIFFEKNLPAIWRTWAIEEGNLKDGFANPYVTFFREEKVTITCRHPDSNEISCWVFALEH